MITIKILIPEEMRKCDRYTIDVIGVPSLVLMEKAAHTVCQSIYKKYGQVPQNALILCGTGNNAGDGLAVARELTDLGCQCKVCMCMGIKNLSPDTLAEFNLLAATECEIMANRDFNEELSEKYEIIIDAIFGTGLNREIPEKIDRLLKKINRCSANKIAIDVPTGIDSETGFLLAENPFMADITVTFAFKKTGLLFYPAKKYVGELITTYIGISQDTPEKIKWKRKYIINRELASQKIPQRCGDGHKGTFGKLCVIGGSEKYKGAPVLSMKAALKSGVGLIKGIVPKYTGSCNFYTPEMIVTDEYADNNFHNLSNYEDLIEEANSCDAVVIGPGLGRHKQTIRFVRKFITEYTNPLLIDADGLFAVSGKSTMDLLAKRNAATVITPHMKEFSRLTGYTIDEIKKDRVHILENVAEKYKSTIVLKDSTTLIATSSKEVFINTSGNNGLASGGSGDVLSGIIGTFLAQGVPSIDASIAGVYLHGLSADLYTEKKYIGSFLPSDICELLPVTIQNILK